MLCLKISTSWGKLAPAGRHGRHVFATLILTLLKADQADWWTRGEERTFHKSPVSKDDLARLDIPGRHQPPTSPLHLRHCPQLTFAPLVVEAEMGRTASYGTIWASPLTLSLAEEARHIAPSGNLKVITMNIEYVNDYY